MHFDYILKYMKYFIFWLIIAFTCAVVVLELLRYISLQW